MGGPERRYAANKFFLYTFVGSVITFAGILYLAIRAAAINGTGVITFDLVMLSTLNGLSAAEQSLLFVAFFCGFAIKVPFFPAAYLAAIGAHRSAHRRQCALSGCVAETGYLWLPAFLPLPMVPEGAVAWAQVMGGLAIAGIIYGALCCWVQSACQETGGLLIGLAPGLLHARHVQLAADRTEWFGALHGQPRH